MKTRQELFEALDAEIAKVAIVMPVVEQELALDQPKIAKDGKVILDGEEARLHLTALKSAYSDLCEIKTMLTKQFGN